MYTETKKPAYDGDRIMWVPEITEITGAKRVTVYKWFSTGVLPCVKLGGRRGCWQSDLEAATQPSTAGAAA